MASQNRIGFIKRMFSPNIEVESLDAISIGDRFEHHSGPAAVWVVERISRVDVSTIPLVSLAREGHPDLKKTISLAALEDREEFTPAA